MVNLYYTEFPGMYVTEDGYLVDNEGNLYDGDGDLIEENALILENDDEYYNTRIDNAKKAQDVARNAANKYEGMYKDAMKNNDKNAVLNNFRKMNRASYLASRYRQHGENLEREKTFIKPSSVPATAATGAGALAATAAIGSKLGKDIPLPFVNNGIKKAGLAGAAIGGIGGLGYHMMAKYRRNRRDEMEAQRNQQKGGNISGNQYA